MDRMQPKAEDVIAHAERHWGAPCAGCVASLIGHDAVLSLMLGFGDAPLCGSCLAAHHGAERIPFLESAARNVARLPCYCAGWRHSDGRLRAGGTWPEERLPARLAMPEADEDEVDDGEPPPAGGDGSLDGALDGTLTEAAPAESWDAGDRGCGELALELKLRLGRLEPSARLLLQTTDLGAPADIPAWCRLTGNLLVAAAPPRYLIERKARTSTQP